MRDGLWRCGPRRETAAEPTAGPAAEATPAERAELRRGGFRLGIHGLWKLVHRAGMDWYTDQSPRLGASIAFYTVFALAPLVLLVIAIGGSVFGEDAVRGEVKQQFEELIGDSGAEVVETVVVNANQSEESGTLGAVMGVLFLLVGATGVFAELKAALNRIWNVEVAPEGEGYRGYVVSAWILLRDRLLSFAMVVVIAFLLVVSLVVSAVLSGVYEWVDARLPVPAVALQVANALLSVAAITFLFAMVYKVLPDVKIRWRDVLLGALATAVLFTLGKYLIGLYLGRSSFSSVYGAAGSLVVVLIWVYYSIQIFLFGAELTQVHAAMSGRRIEPADYARPINPMRLVEQVEESKGVVQAPTADAVAEEAAEQEAGPPGATGDRSAASGRPDPAAHPPARS